jgi:trimeric autotransporter adhesin
VRGDHYVNSNQRLAADYFYSNRKERANIWTGPVNGINPSGYLYQLINNGFGITDTVTLSPSTVLDARLGLSLAARYVKDAHTLVEVNRG